MNEAIARVGKTLNKKPYDPDAVETLRAKAKKLGAAYGMSNKAIDEAISISKKAHKNK